MRQEALCFSFAALLFIDVCAGVKVIQKETLLFEPLGASITMSCAHDDPSFIAILWYRQHGGHGVTLVATSVSGSDPTFEESFKAGYELSRPEVLRASLKILSATEKDSATYFCAASRDNFASEQHFGAGTKLTVLEEGLNSTAPKVALFDPSPQEVKERGSATLVCLATNFYPDHVVLSWSVNGVERTEGVKTDDQPTRGSDKMYSLSSRLRIPKKEWMNPQTTFRCHVYFEPTNDNFTRKTKGREGCGATADSFRKSANTGKLTYLLLIAKSALYGLFATVLVLKLMPTHSKHFS